MGLIFSRENARNEELDDERKSNLYRYPPKSGNYFGSHFIMGGERFETSDPESYLFGENSDLNFLGGRPTPFPYAAPQPHEPTRTLRSLMNIRKESLRFIKVPESRDPSESTSETVESTQPSTTRYSIEFIFDSDVRCNVTIKYFCTEEITPNGVIYKPKDPSMSSETYQYKKGVHQQFSQPSHTVDPSKYPEDMLNYSFDDELHVPVVIECLAEEGDEPRQCHILLAIVEKMSANAYSLKPLQQKLFVDGLCYLMKEIYGIENKNVNITHKGDLSEEEMDDTGSECVICINDVRNTLILPCRHLCLCQGCADSLRYQANNCPICRAPFRALLQISAVRKCTNTMPSQVGHNPENQPSQDIPPGYEPVSLIEALNGPMQAPAPIVPSFVPQIPPFSSNSPDIRQKHRNLERHHSSSASLRHSENIGSEKETTSFSTSDKIQDVASVSPPEVVVASVISSDKAVLKSESLSLTRSEGRRHRKGFRTSSAPEKMRLLANSVQIVNEVGAKRKMDREKDAELAETKSLLESNVAAEDISGAGLSSPKTSRPCSRNSPISLSTPHSLHLCEKSSKDTSPGGDDSDYYTPEDPSTTILVDQGTDTSLDTPQGSETSHINDPVMKMRGDYPIGKHKVNRERHSVVDETAVTDDSLGTLDSSKRNSDPLKKTDNILTHVKSPNCHSLVVSLENPNSLPSTPASNASNHSSGDSFSSTSSTRLLLRPQSCDALPE